MIDINVLVYTSNEVIKSETEFELCFCATTKINFFVQSEQIDICLNPLVRFISILIVLISCEFKSDYNELKIIINDVLSTVVEQAGCAL